MYCLDTKNVITIAVILALGPQPWVSCLDNGLALTPPMGWIAWTRFVCTIDCAKYPNGCINSRLFEAMTDRLVADGYKEAGYEYVNIDDCWSSMERDPESLELLPDPDRFPAFGIRDLADYMHAKGLKLGIYGDCGTKTCAGYPAQLKTEENLQDNYMKLDAETFANWEVDSFKFDNCYLNASLAESICPNMAEALNSTGRPILLSIEWPDYMLSKGLKPNWKLAADSANLWRYYIDVEDTWNSIERIIDFTIGMQNTIKQFHGPGHWFDPDQLVIGNFGLSFEQAQSQMAIWSIWAAPLYMSNDLRSIDKEMRDILLNKKLIEVNQDKLGVFGLMVKELGDYRYQWNQVFVKPIEPIKNGCPSFAIVYLNRAVLGNGERISFKLGNLLKGSAIDLAASRYNSIYADSHRPGREFSAPKCIKRITGVMSGSDANNSVNYDVFDLIEHKSLGKLSVDDNLTLWVNLNGVRAVKLTEAD